MGRVPLPNWLLLGRVLWLLKNDFSMVIFSFALLTSFAAPGSGQWPPWFCSLTFSHALISELQSPMLVWPVLEISTTATILVTLRLTTLKIFHCLQAHSVTSELAFQRSFQNLKVAVSKRNSSVLCPSCPSSVASPFPDSLQVEALEWGSHSPSPLLNKSYWFGKQNSLVKIMGALETDRIGF